MNKEEAKQQMKNITLPLVESFIENADSIQTHADQISKLRVELNEILTDEENYNLTSKIKAKVQREINESLNKSGGSGRVIVATGVGKSKAMVDRIRVLSVGLSFKVLIVVPTEKLRDEGWRDEFIKWKAESVWQNNVKTICYASLESMTDFDWDIVILDEGHNITEANSIFFNYYKRATILLTATYPNNRIKANILDKIVPQTVYELDTDTAVKLGIVAPYDITIVNVPLNRIERNVKAGSKAKPFYTTEYKNYEYLFELCISTPKKFNFLKRMRFIYNLQNKARAAKYLLDNVIPKDYRTLIFAGSIEQAEQLCEHTHHSKSKKNSSLSVFKSGDINRMACVDALNEGENIDNLDCGLIVKLDSNSLNLVQRIGRIIRYRAGHRGKIIILCAYETVDKQWVDKATAGFDTFNIKVVDINDLANGVAKIEF